SERQAEAKTAISAALTEYNVNAIDTLIGDIVPPDTLMKTLTDRKLAEQERVTYETQRLAQEVKQQLEQATALAATQAKVVDAERQVAIAEFNARATVKAAEGHSEALRGLNGGARVEFGNGHLPLGVDHFSLCCGERSGLLELLLK